MNEETEKPDYNKSLVISMIEQAVDILREADKIELKNPNFHSQRYLKEAAEKARLALLYFR